MLINQSEVRKMIGINGKKASHATIKKLINNKTLPQPTKVANQLCWLKEDVDASIRKMMQE